LVVPLPPLPPPQASILENTKRAADRATNLVPFRNSTSFTPEIGRNCIIHLSTFGHDEGLSAHGIEALSRYRSRPPDQHHATGHLAVFNLGAQAWCGAS